MCYARTMAARRKWLFRILLVIAAVVSLMLNWGNWAVAGGVFLIICFPIVLLYGWLVGPESDEDYPISDDNF